MNIINSLRNLFMSKKKRFINALYVAIRKDSYAILDQIDTKLPLDQVYTIVDQLIREGKLEGFLIKGKHLYFLPVKKDFVSQIKTKLKMEGRISLLSLKTQLPFKEFLLKAVLKRIEQGYAGREYYYSTDYVKSYLITTLSDVELYDMIEVANKLGIPADVVVNITNNLIENNELQGLIRNEHEYISKSYFEELLAELLTDLRNNVNEISFSEIAEKLRINEDLIEPFLVKIVEKNPSDYTVYPLEKKLRFRM